MLYKLLSFFAISSTLLGQSISLMDKIDQAQGSYVDRTGSVFYTIQNADDTTAEYQLEWNGMVLQGHVYMLNVGNAKLLVALDGNTNKVITSHTPLVVIDGNGNSGRRLDPNTPSDPGFEKISSCKAWYGVAVGWTFVGPMSPGTGDTGGLPFGEEDKKGNVTYPLGRAPGSWVYRASLTPTNILQTPPRILLVKKGATGTNSFDPSDPTGGTETTDAVGSVNSNIKFPYESFYFTEKGYRGAAAAANLEVSVYYASRLSRDGVCSLGQPIVDCAGWTKLVVEVKGGKLDPGGVGLPGPGYEGLPTDPAGKPYLPSVKTGSFNTYPSMPNPSPNFSSIISTLDMSTKDAVKFQYVIKIPYSGCGMFRNRNWRILCRDKDQKFKSLQLVGQQRELRISFFSSCNSCYN